MVRLSGFLDDERDRRRRISPTNNIRQGNGNSVGVRSGRGTGPAGRIHDNLTTTSNRNDETASGRMQLSDLSSRGAQMSGAHSYRGRDGGRQHVSSTSQPTQQLSSARRNQERLRPKLLKAIPTVIKQESIEMEPLLSESIPRPSNNFPQSESTTISKHTTMMGTQFVNHRGSTTHRDKGYSLPHQYNDFHLDDEEGDIVCCDDCFRHEGTKNICTIFIWAAFIFFIMNRFFLHMSNYLHREGETKVVVVGDNFTVSG